MARTYKKNKDELENQCTNTVHEQPVDIRNRPIIDDDKEVDLEVIDLMNLNKRRGVDDIKGREILVNCGLSAALSTTSPSTSTVTTTVLDIENCHNDSSRYTEAKAAVVGGSFRFSCPESPGGDSGAVLSTEENTKAALATENLLTDEEAVIAAAAAAAALAKLH
ncbi:hypothetical protein HAX54_003119 [Datura stramonium]|uniref:Uncharacterized protein n=1 Tax=Datura stramonium TaxID=4076 RepID=A0ABS8T4W8_DATST|nr:hypothetical protein [Datura stramonium]